MFLIYAGIFMGLVIALLIYPLWMKRNRNLITGEAASQDEERINLQIEKQTLLGSLADLEVDHSQGKLAPEDCHRLKLSFEHRLLILLQLLENSGHEEGRNPSPASPLPSRRRWSIALSLILALLVASGTAGIHNLVYGKIARSQQASGEGGGGGEGTPPVNPVEMVARLEKKLKENPNDLQGQMMAGRSYAALQRWDDARNAWKKAVELDGKNEAAQFNYADALLRTAAPDDQAAYKEALEHLEIALMKVPREPVVLWSKGIALLHLGRNMEADQAWTAAYQYLPPGSKDAEFVKKALENLRSGKVPAN
jgi:cytochrome c-type biogenesis protein CcmH/NrfG